MIQNTNTSLAFVTPQSLVRGQTIFNSILQSIVVDGGYEAALLSDSDGFAIAAEPFNEKTDMMAAVAALLRDTAGKTREQLDLDYINELSLVANDQQRFVCRFFQTDTGQSLSLTVVAPATQTYRRITNQAITKIKEACQQLF